MVMAVELLIKEKKGGDGGIKGGSRLLTSIPEKKKTCGGAGLGG